MQSLTKLISRLGGMAAALGGLLWDAKIVYESTSDQPYTTDITDRGHYDFIPMRPLLFQVTIKADM